LLLPLPLLLSVFSAPPLSLHSFPTRRSSDLSLAFSCLPLPSLAFLILSPTSLPTSLPSLLNLLLLRPIILLLFPSFSLFPSFNQDRKSTRLNSSHVKISYAVFCLKKKIHNPT